MNEREKRLLVKQLKKKNNKLYGTMTPDDAIKIHKIRKSRGKE